METSRGSATDEASSMNPNELKKHIVNTTRLTRAERARLDESFRHTTPNEDARKLALDVEPRRSLRIKVRIDKDQVDTGSSMNVNSVEEASTNQIGNPQKPLVESRKDECMASEDCEVDASGVVSEEEESIERNEAKTSPRDTRSVSAKEASTNQVENPQKTLVETRKDASITFEDCEVDASGEVSEEEEPESFQQHGAKTAPRVTRSMSRIQAEEEQEKIRVARSMMKQQSHSKVASLKSGRPKDRGQRNSKKSERQKKRTQKSEAIIEEKWDMVRHAHAKDQRRPCSTKGCNRFVVAVWATNLNPKDEWFTCQECLIEEFGGWPEGSRPEFVLDVYWEWMRSATREDEPGQCSNKGCMHKAVTVWATKAHPDAEWLTCEECNLWLPEDEIPISQLMKSSEHKESSDRKHFDQSQSTSTSSPRTEKNTNPIVDQSNSENLNTIAQSTQSPSSSSSQKRPCGDENTSPSGAQPGKKKRKGIKINNSVTVSRSTNNTRTTQEGQSPFATTQGNDLPRQLHQTLPAALPITSPAVARLLLQHVPERVSTNPSICLDKLQNGRSTSSSPQSVPDLVTENPVLPSEPSPDDRVMATIRLRKLSDGPDRSRSSWSGSKVLYHVPKNGPPPEQQVFEYKLRRGGSFKVYPNLYSREKLASVEKEVLNCGLFRQYKIQGQDEPRVHFLLHENATDDYEAPQPGYSYANLSVKSRPLNKLPILEKVSKELADACKVPSWNIGVNPVIYRGSKDSMGEHADDDQGEEVILCLIVASPKQPRRIRITPKARGEQGQENDECIELTLSAGDAYEMDQEMQKHYFHSVPKRNEEENEEKSVRLCIVFRTGDDVKQSTDSGRPCEDLVRKEDIEQIFGRKISGLYEGQVYTREELFKMGAHRMQQRGISGKIETGADAIIISGLREDKLGCDRFFQFVYAVERAKGGEGVKTSFQKRLPIRVFRSSRYESPFRAISKNERKDSSAMYRYDGLYKVVNYREPLAKGRPYIFEFQRLNAGEDNWLNQIPNCVVLGKCAHIGTIQTQGAYAPIGWHPNLIDEVHDTLIPTNFDLSRIVQNFGTLGPNAPLIRNFGTLGPNAHPLQNFGILGQNLDAQHRIPDVCQTIGITEDTHNPNIQNKRKRGGDKGDSKKRKAKSNSVFQPPWRLSEEMQKITGKEILSRRQVIKAMWAYIKEHELQNPEDKQEILCDENLKVVMGGRDKVTMWKMHSFWGGHLLEKLDKSAYRHEEDHNQAFSKEKDSDSGLTEETRGPSAQMLTGNDMEIEPNKKNKRKRSVDNGDHLLETLDKSAYRHIEDDRPVEESPNASVGKDLPGSHACIQQPFQNRDARDMIREVYDRLDLTFVEDGNAPIGTVEDTPGPKQRDPVCESPDTLGLQDNSKASPTAPSRKVQVTPSPKAPALQSDEDRDSHPDEVHDTLGLDRDYRHIVDGVLATDCL